MSIIQFSNGQKVEFSGNPTDSDVAHVASQLGIAQAPTPAAPTAPTPSKQGNGGFLDTLAGVGKAVVKGAVVDPFNALVVRPAVRTGEAVGALGLQAADKLSGGAVNRAVQSQTGQNLSDRLSTVIGQDVQTPFGTTVQGVKGFGAGGGKQIAGEGLEAATDIASLAFSPGAAKGALKANTFLKGAVQGAKAGVLSGGLFGAGQGAAKSLQKGDPLSEVAAQGISQGVIGAATGGIVGGVVGGATGAIRGAVERHQAILEGLAQERQPTNIIEYSRTGTPNPQAGKAGVGAGDGSNFRGYRIDKTAKEALDQGVDPLDVQFIKNANDSDKKAFREMYNTAVKASQDKTFAGQPQEVVGKTLVEKAQFIDGVRKQVGKQLGDAAKAMPQTPIDVTGAVSKFEENLGNAGIYADDVGKLNFDGSRYADQPAVQKALQKVYDSVDDNMSPTSIITARQRIFTNQKYANAANEIVPGDFADSMIGQLYDTLDDPLKASNKGYGNLAQKYAQSSNSLREFGQLIGKNFDLGDKFTDLRAGEVANRALSNASAKPLSVVSGLEETAKSLGYKGESTARTQVLFSNLLQDPNYDLFKPTQITSLRSRVAQGAVDAAKSFKGGLVPGLSQLAEKGAKTLGGISPEARRLAIEKLIGITQGALKFK